MNRGIDIKLDLIYSLKMFVFGVVNNVQNI